jgi:hypothetical protein
MTTTTKTSADVEREVEATRGQIDQTVEALKDKMQPRELFDEATRMMGSTSNKLLTTVVEQAKANPIPIALIGAGIAWLALSQTRKSTGETDAYSGQYYETYEGYDEEGNFSRKLKRRVSGAVEQAKGALSTAKAKADNAVAGAKEKLATAKTGATDGADEARGRIAGFTTAAQAKAAEARRAAEARFQETLDTEPLILAAIGLAVGAAVGASLPASRTENRLIGPHRDKLVGKGKEVAQTSLEEARTVAQRAYGQVKEELHRQTGPEGDGSTLTDKAKALADAGVSTVREEVDSRLAH